MLISLLKSKIHHARVTEANISYEGSLAIDEEIMEKVGIIEYEKIMVVNFSNGNRLETYAIKAPRKSKSIMLNGGAALLGSTGDTIMVASFILLTPEEAKKHQPQIVILDEQNNIKQIK